MRVKFFRRLCVACRAISQPCGTLEADLASRLELESGCRLSNGARDLSAYQGGLGCIPSVQVIV